ncbi:hypothetical protein K9M78_01770 [Candidatus Bipolaricaulota bacterium]|nr:hypothetical protein [Candidatus Bipolaricaulota bacterium]
MSGWEVFQTDREVIGDYSNLEIELNPGHLIHTDEWTHSIFFQDAPYQVKSGMAI